MDFLKGVLGEKWNELKKFEELLKSERAIVFYAENKASMNHFKTLIFELTEKMNMQHLQDFQFNPVCFWQK